MCAINHLVANKNSACLPCICQWRLHFPSMCLVCVANRACISLGSRFGAGETPLPQPPPPGPLWAPAPSRHTLTPAAALVTAGAQPRRRAWGRGGCSRGLAARCPGRPARARSPSAACVGAQRVPPRGCPPRPTCAHPSPCTSPAPRRWARAPVPPQSRGKQRPGAILGWGERIPGPGVGAARAPFETPAIRRAPLRIPCRASGAGEALSPPWRTILRCQSQAWAPCAGRRGGAGSAVRPGLAAIFRPPPPTYLCLPGGICGQKVC